MLSHLVNLYFCDLCTCRVCIIYHPPRQYRLCAYFPVVCPGLTRKRWTIAGMAWEDPRGCFAELKNKAPAAGSDRGCWALPLYTECPARDSRRPWICLKGAHMHVSGAIPDGNNFTSINMLCLHSSPVQLAPRRGFPNLAGAIPNAGGLRSSPP